MDKIWKMQKEYLKNKDFKKMRGVNCVLKQSWIDKNVLRKENWLVLRKKRMQIN